MPYTFGNPRLSGVGTANHSAWRLFNMKKRSLAALITTQFVAMCLAGTAAAEPVLDGVLSRYPGTVRVVGEKVDTYYLDHGWLTRQAAYQSPDELENVTRWYAAYLPQVEMHESGTCVAL